MVNKPIDPEVMLEELAGRRGNREQMDELSMHLWDRFGGPSGLANEVKNMYDSFDGPRMGHQNQIRLLSDVMKVLIRSADAEETVGDVDPEDLRAELDALVKEETEEDDEV